MHVVIITFYKFIGTIKRVNPENYLQEELLMIRKQGFKNHYKLGLVNELFSEVYSSTLHSTTLAMAIPASRKV